MLVFEDNNRWFPVFMIVDDNKKNNYVFNYKALNLKSKNEYKRNWFETNFINFKVVDSLSKQKRKGVIVDILKNSKNGFPKYVIVKWDDNKYTKEFVVYSQEEVNQNISLKLNNSILEFTEMINYTELVKNIDYLNTVNDSKYNTLYKSKINGTYNGKFKNEKRINLGASPGARSSVNDEYFSLQRLYEVNQSLISDYLNYKRIKKGLSKNEITKLFPEEYKHTVGHWLRKDFGGSLPTPEDWKILIQYLDIDKSVTNYVCKTALRLQTVKHAKYKMPKDFQQIDFLDKLNLLISHSE